MMGASTSRRLGSSRSSLLASRMMKMACATQRASSQRGARAGEARRQGSWTRAHLLVGEAALAEEVVLEEGDVGLLARLVGVELLVGGLEESRGLDVLDDALGRVEDLALVGRVDGEVDRGEAGTAVVDSRDGGCRVQATLVRVERHGAGTRRRRG